MFAPVPCWIQHLFGLSHLLSPSTRRTAPNLHGSQVGAKVSFKTALDDVWVGLGYKAGKYDATIEAEKMMKSFTVKALAKPTSELTIACMATSDLKSAPTGAALCGYKFNADGQFKAKYDMKKLDCAITYKALPKVHPRLP